MAVDTQKLFYLLDPVFQIENLAGKPVVGGHIEVFVAGTDTKYITWQDWDGARNPFKIPLKSDGRAVILVEPQYTYDVYVYDSFNNMVCSRLNVSPAIGGDVSVSGLTQVFHDETISGNGTPQEPIGVVSAGKVYEGIEPIVVNNDLDKISANHVPLGVQDPLYFVQDDEEGCIIGFSGQTVPEGVMTESALGFENNKITGYNGSAFSAGNEYEAGNYISIDNNTINVVNLPTSADVQNIVDVATSGLMPSGDYLTKESADTLYAPTGNYLTGLPDDLVYTADITGFATTAELDNKLDKADSANFLLTSDSAKFYPMESNPSGYLTSHQSLDDYATKQWVEDKGYLTGVDIPESANWNSTYNTVHDNSASWTGGTANPQIPVTSTSGISIFESGDKVYFNISADYAFADDITGKQDSLTFGYHDTAISSIDNSALYDNSAHARINTLAGRISDLSSNKLDTTAFSDVSGNFLTAVPDTYLQNTDLSTTDGKVTAISGIPLSAGGNVAVYTDAALPNSTQLDADIAAGKAICIVYDGRNYWFDRKSSDYYFYGADAYSTYLYYLSFRPENNNWTRGQKVLATQSWVTAGMTAYQPAGDYLTTADSANFYTTANESGFVTSGELPDPVTIGVQEGDTLDTDYDGLKIVKSTANGNEHINLHKKSTDQWLIHGNLVPTSPGSNKYLVTDDSGAMHWDNKSALAYDSAFEQSGGYITAYNGSAFKAGDEFPQSATDAIGYVTATSANIDSTIDNVSANSGAWGGSALPISAGPGISLSIVDGVLVISTGGN